MLLTDLIDALVILLIFAVSLLVIGVLCNPWFWQGYRNSKFIDGLKDKKKGLDTDKLVKP